MKALAGCHFDWQERGDLYWGGPGSPKTLIKGLLSACWHRSWSGIQVCVYFCLCTCVWNVTVY